MKPSHAIVRMQSLAAFLLMSTVALGQLSPAPSEPLFRERPFGPRPEATVAINSHSSDDKPLVIPRAWKVGGLAAVLIGGAYLLAVAARAWRSSNLFDRARRFPRVANVPIRFGGTRSGGHMAIVHFKKTTTPPLSVSGSKDT